MKLMIIILVKIIKTKRLKQIRLRTIMMIKSTPGRRKKKDW